MYLVSCTWFVYNSIEKHLKTHYYFLKMTKVTCTVSGSPFEISCKCLPLMVTEAKKNGTPLVFDIDHPAERFAAILAYYQTGELHIPAGLCPGAFQRELLYWDIDSGKLSDCCIAKYNTYFVVLLQHVIVMKPHLDKVNHMTFMSCKYPFKSAHKSRSIIIRCPHAYALSRPLAIE